LFAGGARLSAQAVDPVHYMTCVRAAYKDGATVAPELKEGANNVNGHQRLDELLDCAADLHALQNHLVPGASVLDAGCGFGFMTGKS
jgi:2-polyprenyl-3-methyl-5-hydroxy-6-metoxy-1,4-benzoquinol methylase